MCPVHLSHLVLITRTIVGEQYRSLSSSLCSFLHSPVNLVTLFAKTLCLGSSLNATYHPRFLYNVSSYQYHSHSLAYVLSSHKWLRHSHVMAQSAAYSNSIISSLSAHIFPLATCQNTARILANCENRLLVSSRMSFCLSLRMSFCLSLSGTPRLPPSWIFIKFRICGFFFLRKSV